MTDWQKGLQAFKEGRMRAAADRLQEAAQEHELSVSQMVRFETLAYLGVALYSLGQAEKSVTAFEGAVRLSLSSSPSTDLSLNLANAYLATGRRENARATLESVLEEAPGHIAAKMLLHRLDNTPPGEPVTGAIMGASAQTVKKYMRTLSFTTVSHGGYDPAQVREALTQLESYIDALDSRIREAQEIHTQQEAEIERYRQMEDALVQNIIQAQHTPGADDQSSLSPIERLFQNKS